MLAYTISGSVYEIDLANRQARRLAGKGAPVPRFGADGTWRKFVAMLPLNVGRQIFFEWDPRALPAGTEAQIGMRPGTLTAPVERMAGLRDEFEAAAAGVGDVSA